MALRPDMAPALVALSDAVYSKSRLPLRVHELARMRIALANECEVCRNARYAEGARDGLDDTFYSHVLDWRNRSWAITAQVEISNGVARGVLLSLGGHGGGWSFYLKDGKAAFAYNLFGLEETIVRADVPQRVA